MHKAKLAIGQGLRYVKWYATHTYIHVYRSRYLCIVQNKLNNFKSIST